MSFMRVEKMIYTVTDAKNARFTETDLTNSNISFVKRD